MTNNKFEQVRHEKKMTNRDFAALLGINETAYSKLKKGTLPVGDKTLHKIQDALPEYNIDWLLKGTEPRLNKDKFYTAREDQDIGTVSDNLATYQGATRKPNPRLEARPLHRASDPNDFDNDGSKFEDLGDGIIRMRVPIVPYKSYAGYLRGYQDPEFYEGLQTVSIDVYKEYRGHYLAFEVEGDSMTTTDPDLFQFMALPGWKAVGRELPRHHWKYKLHTHQTDTWIIVHNTEGILTKNIAHHNVDNRKITIHSLNPKYPDEVLDLDDIDQIFSVVKYIIDK